MPAAQRRGRRAGTEPASARSALGLRLALSLVFAPVFLAAAIGFAILAAGTRRGADPGPTTFAVLAAGCALLAVVAAADAALISRRRRAERDRPRP